MCGGGGSKSSTPAAPVDVKTQATPSRREQAGMFTDNTATPQAATTTSSFGSELGGTSGS
jgi:hypothetical protein